MMLTDFLLERIADDEAAARAVRPLGHNFDMGGNRQDERFTHQRWGNAAEDGYPRPVIGGGEAAHFARWDPARVLAECEAKRKLIDAEPTAFGGAYSINSIRRLQILALPYADHPQFQPEWRP